MADMQIASIQFMPLPDVFRSDQEISVLEMDFFNGVAEALKLTPAEIAGLTCRGRELNHFLRDCSANFAVNDKQTRSDNHGRAQYDPAIGDLIPDQVACDCTAYECRVFERRQHCRRCAPITADDANPCDDRTRAGTA